jgi:hypothetical protein
LHLYRKSTMTACRKHSCTAHHTWLRVAAMIQLIADPN